MTRDEVMKALEENRTAIRRCGVRSLALFGSAARGETHSSSDLDFLVELEHNTFDAYMDLKEFLEKLFQHRVDLVLASELKPRLRDSILRESIDAPGI